jgi:hypothetical protein
VVSSLSGSLTLWQEPSNPRKLDWPENLVGKERKKTVNSSRNSIVVVQVKWWCYIWPLNNKIQSYFTRHDWRTGCVDIPILPIEWWHTKINFEVGYDKKKPPIYKTWKQQKKWINCCSENLNYRENVHNLNRKGLCGKLCRQSELPLNKVPDKRTFTVYMLTVAERLNVSKRIICD